MRTRTLLALATMLLSTAVIAGLARSQEGAPGMSPEEMEMMKKWMEYATPGKPHAALAQRVGTWTLETTMWMAPGAPPMKSTSNCTVKAILGGRYIVEDSSGMVNGMPFSGKGITGYDNAKKQYFNVWFDNMGTGCLMSEGTASADGKVITLRGEYPDILHGGGTMKTRIVVTQRDADHTEMEMYEQSGGNPERKNMEILYTRLK